MLYRSRVIHFGTQGVKTTIYYQLVLAYIFDNRVENI